MGLAFVEEMESNKLVSPVAKANSHVDMKDHFAKDA